MQLVASAHVSQHTLRLGVGSFPLNYANDVRRGAERRNGVRVKGVYFLHARTYYVRSRWG